MSDGWIKIHREIKEWRWYKDCKTKSVFLHLLLNANYKEGYFEGYKVLRGQLITGRKALANDLSLSEREVRTALDRLKKSGEIAQQATNKFSLITVIKYEDYQCDNNSDSENRPASDQQATSKRPANDQQTTTNKKEYKAEKDKQDKKVKNKYSADAEEFWLQTKYARRNEDDKAGVLKKYQALRKTYSHEDLILSVSRRFDYMASWSRKWGLRRMLEPLNIQQTFDEDFVDNNQKNDAEQSNIQGLFEVISNL